MMKLQLLGLAVAQYIGGTAVASAIQVRDPFDLKGPINLLLIDAVRLARAASRRCPVRLGIEELRIPSEAGVPRRIIKPRRTRPRSPAMTN